MNFNIKKITLLAAMTVCAAVPVFAAVVQTVGTGSAVKTVSAVANFENSAAASSTSYTENGLQFQAYNMSSNPCGYAGCAGSFSGFSGNYMYGVGLGGYFTISAATGKSLTGLEFVADTGYGVSQIYFGWEALLNGVSVGSGAGSASRGSVLAFSSASGFDSLRWTANYTPDMSDYAAPAFDNVRAQYASPSDVPEPASMALLGVAALGMAVVRRRARKAAKA